MKDNNTPNSPNDKNNNSSPQIDNLRRMRRQTTDESFPQNETQTRPIMRPINPNSDEGSFFGISSDKLSRINQVETALTNRSNMEMGDGAALTNRSNMEMGDGAALTNRSNMEMGDGATHQDEFRPSTKRSLENQLNEESENSRLNRPRILEPLNQTVNDPSTYFSRRAQNLSISIQNPTHLQQAQTQLNATTEITIQQNQLQAPQPAPAITQQNQTQVTLATTNQEPLQESRNLSPRLTPPPFRAPQTLAPQTLAPQTLAPQTPPNYSIRTRQAEPSAREILEQIAPELSPREYRDNLRQLNEATTILSPVTLFDNIDEARRISQQAADNARRSYLTPPQTSIRTTSNYSGINTPPAR